MCNFCATKDVNIELYSRSSQGIDTLLFKGLLKKDILTKIFFMPLSETGLVIRVPAEANEGLDLNKLLITILI